MPLIAFNWQSNAAYNQYDTPAGGVTQDWLVTSAIDLSGVSGSELRFFTKQEFNTLYNSAYEVRISTTSQTDQTSFSAISGGSWTEANLNASPTVYEEKVLNLSAFDGLSTVYIAFIHTNDDGDSWYIDDVSVAASSTCNAPGSLNAAPFTTTADLSWGSVALELGGYDWRVMDDGDDPDVDVPAANGSTATEITTDTATGIVGSTQYDLYVRTICSVGPTAWSTVYNFANDMSANATDLTTSIGANSTGGTYSNVASTAEAVEVGNGTCWFNTDTANNSVWFKFTAQGNASYIISTNYSGQYIK